MRILVREVRVEKGLSQEELAIKAGISRKQLISIENNYVDPRLSSICALARALKVNPGDLFSCYESRIGGDTDARLKYPITTK